MARRWGRGAALIAERVDVEDLSAGRHVLDATVRVKATRLSKTRSFMRC